MSDAKIMSDDTPQVKEAPPPSSADPATAGNIKASKPPTEEYTAATRVGSMAEIKEISPKLWNAMMMGIAQNICRDMKDHQDRIVKLMREGRRND